MIRETHTAEGAQSNGIAQINKAVGLVDRTTLMNAALVEQSAAVQTVTEHAQWLAQVVVVFVLACIVREAASNVDLPA